MATTVDVVDEHGPDEMRDPRASMTDTITAAEHFDSPTITGTIGDDAIAVLVMDDPDHPTNTMNEAFGRSLTMAVEWLEAVRHHYVGVIVTSGKSSFFAGGDLRLLRDSGPGDEGLIAGALDTTKDRFRRLEMLGKPVVAALGGTALGGGFEVALACHRRIALSDSRSRFGLPEVTLGLLPGAGGITRTVRMFGVIDALGRVILHGRRMRPAEALEVGMIDDIVETVDDMMLAARTWILANPSARQPWDRDGFVVPGGAPSRDDVAAAIPGYAAITAKKVLGEPLPAPTAAVAAAVDGALLDFAAASAVETRHCTALACGPVSGNIIQSMFFDMGTVAKGVSRPRERPYRLPEKVLVVGAGMMGAAIAHAVASAGIPVVLLDVTVEKAERGKGYSRRLLTEATSTGKMSESAADHTLSRIVPTADPSDARGCDLVVEAVLEDVAIKQEAFARVAPFLAPDAVLCSNTSTLPIETISAGIDDPGAVIGTHFLSPVDTMPVVEIVVGPNTGDDALSRAFDFIGAIRKTPIVVGDGPGFFTTRVIGRFMDEAVSLVAEGVHPMDVEIAAGHAGYPTGPLASMDEISLSFSRRIREALIDAAAGDGRPRATSASYPLVDRLIDEFDRPGRAVGRGFYDYADDGSRIGLWPGIEANWYRPDHGITEADMMDRMLVAQTLDAAACLDEGVLRSVAEANVGSILGIGFPAWTGGVLQFANQFDGGVQGLVRRADELRSAYGDRFVVPASLRERTVPFR